VRLSHLIVVNPFGSYYTQLSTLGPPGTGKTTTIAAAVAYWISQREPAWIVAQSNVGVKNIARSLAGKGITDFKIIVSKEFYVEWSLFFLII
jgi:hypothetical protein